ncbi:hypothetical protein V4D30_02190 [Thermodesulfovibrio sp. 3907-1M]|uniref:Uncharacterized protein n=1 Tax=Thermodesulfovibrio autotrophicus TaxID=3118333 RepID=A0AAU8GX34_9BACT
MIAHMGIKYEFLSYFFAIITTIVISFVLIKTVIALTKKQICVEE